MEVLLDEATKDRKKEEKERKRRKDELNRLETQGPEPCEEGSSQSLSSLLLPSSGSSERLQSKEEEGHRDLHVWLSLLQFLRLEKRFQRKPEIHICVSHLWLLFLEFDFFSMRLTRHPVYHSFLREVTVLNCIIISSTPSFCLQMHLFTPFSNKNTCRSHLCAIRIAWSHNPLIIKYHMRSIHCWLQTRTKNVMQLRLHSSRGFSFLLTSSWHKVWREEKGFKAEDRCLLHTLFSTVRSFPAVFWCFCGCQNLKGREGNAVRRKGGIDVSIWAANLLWWKGWKRYCGKSEWGELRSWGWERMPLVQVCGVHVAGGEKKMCEKQSPPLQQ